MTGALANRFHNNGNCHQSPASSCQLDGGKTVSLATGGCHIVTGLSLGLRDFVASFSSFLHLYRTYLSITST